MISLQIKNGELTADVEFPVSENELRGSLSGINAPSGISASSSVFVSEVYCPKELEMLKDRFLNLDELNYLAKRMDSFDGLECDQFLIGISKLKAPTEKDLINLTFNLDKFTLCRDVSDYGRIGRAYVLNTEGSVPTGDEADPKYAVIGKDLVDRGLTQITERGLLVYDPAVELTEVYDGRCFPPYYYGESPLAVLVKRDDREELVQLPTDDIAIEKALARVGALLDSDCEITLDSDSTGAFSRCFMRVVRDEGLYYANVMMRAIDPDYLDWDKLAAAVALTGAHKAADIAAVSAELDDFVFVPHAVNEEDIGNFFVNNFAEYDLHEDMEEFFDFEAFGKHIVDKYDGRFVDVGFVCCTRQYSFEKLLERINVEDAEDEGMNMGGI
jgi:hypothetical protein